jgi:hypothetical protein
MKSTRVFPAGGLTALLPCQLYAKAIANWLRANGYVPEGA